MRTTKPNSPAKTLAPLSLLCALAAPAALAVDITGDTVTSDLTVEGDDIIINNNGSESFQLRFRDLTTNESHFWNSEASDWIWDYDESSTTRTAMMLGHDHLLNLYSHESTPAVTISLDPGTGTGTAKITIETNEVVTSANALTVIGGTGGKFVERDTNNAGSVDSLLMEGTYLGPGLIPRTGAGTRMMWYPEKAAFRAGQSGGTNWDTANVGYNSAAFGVSNRAKGAGAFAAGSYNIADGTSAVAFGNLTEATGNYSFAATHQTKAQGSNSVALGFGSKATKTSAVAVGNEVEATGDFSFAANHKTDATNTNAAALGYLSVSSGSASFAAGTDSDAIGHSAFAVGYHTLASGNYSSALGNGSNAYGYNSVAAGFGCKMHNYGGVAVGSYNEDRHTPGGTAITAWQGNSAHSVFEVGIGTFTTPKNVLTALQDGSLELGKATTHATDPNHVPLKINADGTIIIAKPQGDISMGVYD